MTRTRKQADDRRIRRLKEARIKKVMEAKVAEALREEVDKRPLSFRDFPTNLYWKCREEAARRRMSFKQYVIRALGEAVERDSKDSEITFHAGEESELHAESSSDDV